MSSALHATPQAFIDHWTQAEANERANSQSFLIGLTQLLGVPAPAHNHAEGYSFEFPVKVPGGQSTNFIDLYRRAHFILESKQFTAQKLEQSALEQAAIQAGAATVQKKSGPVRGTGGWDDAMIRAKGQAERYVRYLPAEEPNPPFLIVCDVGHSFEVYADFTQNGKAYLPFPDPRSFRIQLRDLADEKVRERLHLIWTNPLALDPAKISAEVTREIAGYLAELAKSLEQDGHDAEVTAQFLTRCLFCMFAEDVGLLPDRGFTELLDSVPKDGTGFEDLLGQLFREMNTGTGKGISVVLRKKLLQFNGGLFADHTVLPVNALQLGLLKQAASKQWKNVEPAIFGTLLERALVPEERHALGAHFTPRAYVERLVLPTVIDPLREQWANVRAAAVTHARADDLKKARKEIHGFHQQLCQIRVLDPACGSGNFLYVALQHLKILEGEVLDTAAQFGADMTLELETHAIDPHQFLGIELNPRAASIAELVLWIGYLQWHFKIHGQRTPPEPILRAFKNIECRDAVLAYDGEPQPEHDADGNTVTVWDRRSTKTDLVTNREVPDETKRVPLLTYANPRPAVWPEADYIVGNPPFIGTRTIRPALGDGYLSTLRETCPDVPENADYVMYWWNHAAQLALDGNVKRFGLITTNSFTQKFNRAVVANRLIGGALRFKFAIPDHPWVDSADGAAIRIAMSVVAAGQGIGVLESVVSEQRGDQDGAAVELKRQQGLILPNLTIGCDIDSALELSSNAGLSSVGYQLTGTGFTLTMSERDQLIRSEPLAGSRFIFPLLSARDLTQEPRSLFAIDLCGTSTDEIRSEFPHVFQWVLTRVKPERDSNRRDRVRERWWVFEEPRNTFRPALRGLKRIIATPITAKHRPFIFCSPHTVADSTTVMVGLDDAFHLGVLSCRVHFVFALAAGGTLEDRPRYNKSRCFDPFPFPLCNEAEKEKIRSLAEALDAHRKRAQAAHPGLTLTGMYNVLEKLRQQSGPHSPLGGQGDSDGPETAQRTVRTTPSTTLTDKERLIHDQGLVSILKQLHDDLDAAVSAAYGWPATLSDAEILDRLVTLNAQRAEEEKRGIIHWLRPDYQSASQKATSGEQDELALKSKKPVKAKAQKQASTKEPWPKPLADRIRATEAALHAAGRPVTAADLTPHFTRAKPADLQEILESLSALGRARQDGETFSV